LNLEIIANTLYGPSCISFESALAFYGLIAERPQMITSLAIGDSKLFKTPVGNFQYRAIAPSKFKIGINYINLGKEVGYFIATREKALVDFVYRTSGIRTLNQLSYYLFEEMRIDKSMFGSFDFKKIKEIASLYDKNSVKMLGEL
jgi:predicted transcriptional regulator of viral defense system